MLEPALPQGNGSTCVCQFGLSRSGLYGVAEWFLASVAERYAQIRAGAIEDISRPQAAGRRFITLESLRLEFLSRGLEECVAARAAGWIQLRDPYNWLASLQEGVRTRAVRWPQTISLAKWKDYARLCQDGEKWISFNRWFDEASYRRLLAERLGFVRNRAGEAWEQIPARGGGSSFDQLRYHGSAQAMKVLDRYQLFAKQPEWRAHFDEEVVWLGESLFGMKRPW